MSDGRLRRDGARPQERGAAYDQEPERDSPAQWAFPRPLSCRSSKVSLYWHARRAEGRSEGQTVATTFLRSTPAMAFATLNFHSPVLAKACSMNVIFPECSVGQPPFPVCYLLHGLSDDHTTWARRTSIERHVLEDVIGFVDRTFNTIPERQGRGSGGPSMGG